MSPIPAAALRIYEGGVRGIVILMMAVSRDFLADIDSSEKKGQKA